MTGKDGVLGEGVDDSWYRRPSGVGGSKEDTPMWLFRLEQKS